MPRLSRKSAILVPYYLQEAYRFFDFLHIFTLLGIFKDLKKEKKKKKPAICWTGFCKRMCDALRLSDALVAVNCEVAELFLDAKELVVLGHTVGAAEGAGLDLAAVGGYCDVGDGSVLSLA